jgi:hypothetical protein
VRLVRERLAAEAPHVLIDVYDLEAFETATRLHRCRQCAWEPAEQRVKRTHLTA